MLRLPIPERTGGGLTKNTMLQTVITRPTVRKTHRVLADDDDDDPRYATLQIPLRIRNSNAVKIQQVSGQKTVTGDKR